MEILEIKKILNNEEGFSLQDSLFALVIMAIGLMGALPLFMMGTQGINDSQNRTVAGFLASSKIEELRVKPFESITDDIALDQPASESAVSIFRSVDIDDGDDSSTLEVGDEPVDTDMKRVTVSISWPVPGGQMRSISITSYIFRH
ncbi:MAG: hypothetical protein A2161_07590 [Candidatus Schekmanbacteria bacterium RBG_13_48_7]|uniref:Type II secretion system protein n=1 Tax=Candidatus Schekmanbacteria bacterium RBG_13_48_7 TaxID=1817878 RepID=A0A1F7S353_9BACT|nr:MAG: hypothetical protein A2161_07590 [Candidatus Schekmanbacteria bacterium RBG_13_48_7]